MAQQVDVMAQKADYGRVFEQPFAILFCACNVAVFVDCVFDVKVGFSFLRRCASSQNVEESGPGDFAVVVSGNEFVLLCDDMVSMCDLGINCDGRLNEFGLGRGRGAEASE
jgi:hypothetical protein